jgi:diaminopimelate epimerase
MNRGFNKYQGTGNDFIIIDNRASIFNAGDTRLISRMCDRRFGIGADGLILISDLPGYDFEMKYFNSDGRESTMCGNGGRCTAAFALRHSIAGNNQKFRAIDGIHTAVVLENEVRLSMNDVTDITTVNGNYFLNTGSPHYVVPVADAVRTDVLNEGRKIRYSESFAPGGTNVNFVEYRDDGIFVRTYERGVEDETLSCGTGVTASAIASVLSGHFVNGNIDVTTKGGKLNVEFIQKGNIITGIWLTGPATFVFEGVINF